jgi:hypothetical protein
MKTVFQVLVGLALCVGIGAVLIYTSFGFAAMVCLTWASSFAWKHLGSLHYVESGQIASLSCWLLHTASETGAKRETAIELSARCRHVMSLLLK